MTPDERKAYRTRMNSERQENRKKLSEQVQKLHQESYRIMLSNEAWDPRMHQVITKITELLEDAKAQSKQKSIELKEEGLQGKKKKNKLHEEKTMVIVDTDWNGSDGWLTEIEKFCTHHNLINTLGMKLPEANRDGSRFLTVAIMFLSKAKEVIMSGFLHVKAQRAKQGIADEAECEFVNTSYAANNLISKLRGKDRYMPRLDPSRPDAKALNKCRHMIKELEGMRWKSLNEGKPLPKHFKLAPPREEGKKQGKGNHDKGKHDTDEAELELMRKMLDMMAKKHKHQNHNSQPPHKKNNPDHALPREASTRPGPARVNPARVNPGRPPRTTQAYMHGYYY